MRVHNTRHIYLLLILYLLLLFAGIFLIKNYHLDFSIATYSSLITFMVIITAGVYVIISLGIRRKDKEKGIYFLAGLGGKFLAYLILILIYWLILKNLSHEFIIAFFVLYLVFTIFLLSVLIKMLKIK